MNTIEKNDYYDTEIPQSKITELINDWHTSRAISNKRHDRMIYVMKQFHKRYPQYSEMKIYKTLDRAIAGLLPLVNPKKKTRKNALLEYHTEFVEGDT